MIKPENPLRIGLAGFGTVGSGLAYVVRENMDWIQERTGRAVQISKVLVRHPEKIRQEELPAGALLTTDPRALTEDPNIDVVVELIGGITAARSLIMDALNHGKHVVSANKALLAENSRSIFRLAEEKNVTLAYEASVAGGIPIVQVLKESLAGNRILALTGILNGTANYILSRMTDAGLDFSTALTEAQQKGFAEADPTLDIDGMDAAHKLVLLIRLAWGLEYPYEQLPVTGIRDIARMDIAFAREFGFKIKLLGHAQMQHNRLEAGVFPTLVAEQSLLASVSGAFNAINIQGNAVGSVFLHGQGAGSLPTASAVLGDIIAIARHCLPLNTGFIRQTHPTADMLPPEEAVNCYYMRLMIDDAPGMLRDIAGIMADQSISIATALQKSEQGIGVPLVMLTHEAQASALASAMQTMRAHDLLRAEPVCYRVIA